MIEKTAQIAGGHVDLERPGSVGITEDEAHVRNVLKHGAFVGHQLVEVLLFTVHHQIHTPASL
ncbi:hypothetical protein D3C76_1589720 [compost metagenome]